ncbi:unnamed protein product, partial [Mesorhabditis belari]|uniref:Ion transport domain-containing protein n=1 Tax=Mesorhabditis belari TaxID=2138241 RepID=A0AAF3FRR4_9BILA
MGGFQSQQSDPENEAGFGRRQEDRLMYKLVDMHGGGELIAWMRYAGRYGDYSMVEGYFDSKVSESMYNQGKGKIMSINELVKIRNQERNDYWQRLLAKRQNGKTAPNLLDHFNQEGNNTGDVQKALKLLDGGGKKGKNESKYRDVVWKFEERGSMGETLMGVALLTTTPAHHSLVVRLANEFPKLVNDYCISEDYYGMSPLHQAIINEDCHMAHILLKKGANVHTRCYGAFFCAEDQRSHRGDIPDEESVQLPIRTNYTGRMYFGEYPLSFAACMNEEDCFRLLIAYKANPNNQDCNGNTVLHMCVIHENLKMLRLAVDKGAKLSIVNRQQLSPLTLAAKLAKREMFVEILGMEADVIWSYADASQTAYPALSLIVYGGSTEHLELLDGLLESIIESKWAAYGRKRWIISFLSFVVYYIFFVVAFILRPISMTTEAITKHNICESGLPSQNTSWWTKLDPDDNWNEKFDELGFVVAFNEGCPITFPGDKSWCHLRDYNKMSSRYFGSGWARLGCEAVVVVCVIAQITMDLIDIRRIGRQKWMALLKSFPAKIIYKFSFLLILLVIPVRTLCFVGPAMLEIDNYLSIISVLFTTVHFLFYCRAIKFIGPFVLMIYTIIRTDILRFVTIYVIFLFGFSQAFYITFNSCEKYKNQLIASGASENESDWVDQDGRLHMGIADFDNILASPQESFIRTFIMTIGEFMSLYRELATCQDPVMTVMGKLCFIVFELLVFVLLFNLLIACLTRTYETIFNTRKEYKRQWAQVILSLEMSLSPQERLIHLLKYSRPIGTNKQRRSYVINKKLNEDNMESYEKRAQDEKSKSIAEEKRFLQKRKLKDLELREGLRPLTALIRPVTSYLSGLGRPKTKAVKSHENPMITVYAKRAINRTNNK